MIYHSKNVHKILGGSRGFQEAKGGVGEGKKLNWIGKQGFFEGHSDHYGRGVRKCPVK